MIKAVVFDMGGVLIKDPYRVITGIVSQSYGIKEEKVNEALHNEGWDSYKKGTSEGDEFWSLFGKKLGKKIDIPALRKETMESFEEIESMISFAKKLKSKGYFVGIISNNIPEWAEAFSKTFETKGVFDAAVLSFEEGCAKPEKEIYEIFIEKTGLKPEECVFIDDKKHNLKPAEELGMKALLFEGQKNLEKGLAKLGVEIN